MDAFDWAGRIIETMTPLGLIVFLIIYIGFLFSGVIYLMKEGGSRIAWFNFVMVCVVLGGGLSYGMGYVTGLLTMGFAGAAEHLPELRRVSQEFVDQSRDAWYSTDSSDGNTTITEGEVTIVATPGPIAAPTMPPPTPSSEPDTPAPEATPLSETEFAATQVVIQQMTATYTPRPPTETPDHSLWNPQTPPPPTSTPQDGGN